MKQKRNSVSSLSSDPAFHYYDDADSSGDEMGEVRGSSKQRVTRSEAKGSGEGGGVGQGCPHDKMMARSRRSSSATAGLRKR